MELSSKHCRCIQLQTTTARVLKFGGLIGNLKTLRAVTMRLKNNVLFKYKLDLNTKITKLENENRKHLRKRSTLPASAKNCLFPFSPESYSSLVLPFGFDF